MDEQNNSNNSNRAQHSENGSATTRDNGKSSSSKEASDSASTRDMSSEEMTRLMPTAADLRRSEGNLASDSDRTMIDTGAKSDTTASTSTTKTVTRRAAPKPQVMTSRNETLVMPETAEETRDSFAESDTSITRVVSSRPEKTSRRRETLIDDYPSTKSLETLNKTRPRASAIDEHNEVSLGGTLNERFVLETILGSGGMGEVYKARDLRRVEMQDSNPYIALKLLRSEFRSDTRFMMALQRESKKVQRLSHPNIVTVYDFDRDGDAAYISMEYLEGEALDRTIFGRGLEKKRALRIIERMARGLAYAHQEGYVHADFKPGNVFLANEGAEKNETNELVKILDFGIAQAVIRDGSGYRNVGSDDNPDMMALTPNYASLEMLKGEQPLPIDDVYSFCCVAYELLTGKHPYADSTGKKRTAVEAQKLGLAPPTIEGIPKLYQRALKKGASLKRKDRFDNAGEFLDAIKPLVSKKQLALAVAFSLVSVFFYFSLDTYNEQKVPNVSSLESVYVSSAEKIREGDSLLKEGDIDLAHRFYAQAWNLGNDLKGVNDSLEILRRIVDDRMNKIADKLIQEATSDDVDDYRLQQLQIALEFVKQDSLGTQDKKIQAVIDKINTKIKP